LLSILLLLHVHGRMTARELSERLEVSERTILRDMEALSGSGVPVVADRGSKGGWKLLEGYQAQLTGLSMKEVLSLFAAITPRVAEDLGLKNDAEAALLKIRASLPGPLAERADFARDRVLIDSGGWRDAGGTVESLPVLLDALWRQRQVKFVYAGALCEEASERVVEPLGVVAKGTTWYLAALSGGELRTYRVSRMNRANVLAEAAVRPKGFDLRTWWERSAAEFREKLPRYYATYLAAPGVVRWAKYKGWRLEETQPHGNGVRLRIRFDAEEEALQFALSFGPDIEVLEPAVLREKVREAAEATARLYAQGEERCVAGG
jgi:predicted DNA-binding transcriptional regulator YafY